MAPPPRGWDGSKSYLLKLIGCICRPPGFWHLFRSGTGQNGSRPGYSETAGLLTRRVAMGRKGEAARRAHAVVTSLDRKSTRLNSSHGYISYAVFCLKKKNEFQ